ncbi:2Fe-2S ferredoxin-like superfamily protein [Thalictrum thalictroides]|uniref:2Fe-2S ferredoxin-like superfamily protein n=1 Tax=Thalictrum thalictroides TaxID=46969 RepID=A0A7J6V4R2_THATH|nr:2Fe-2S ferredoxin-like superfamily protein [Thalictrum thalictroides]
MAFASLQRISTRMPSISQYSRSIITRSTATSTSSSSSSTSAKVSDRIVKLFAIDFEGQKHEIIGLSGHTLLKALTNNGLIDPASHRLEEIDACSAECEVNIAQEWLEKLPPATYDEQYVLKRNARNRILNKHSRLGCQVVLNHGLEASPAAGGNPALVVVSYSSHDDSSGRVRAVDT